MLILSIEDQNKILRQYRKDYEMLVYEYNKYKDSSEKFHKLCRKIEKLSDEINKSTMSHRLFFTDDNLNSAQNILIAVRNLKDIYANQSRINMSDIIIQSCNNINKIAV